MTTTKRRRRYRRHDLLDDRSDTGWFARCTCGWSGPDHLEEGDAHYDGDEHLGLVAYRRLQLSGVIPWAPMGRRFAGGPPAGMWVALMAHRRLLDDGAAAVVDVVATTWPERVGRR